MELVKKNITTELVKGEMTWQFSLEEEKTLSVEQPDASMVYMKKSQFRISDKKVENGKIKLSGNVEYELLCQSGMSARFFTVDGELFLEEELKMENVSSQDDVEITVRVVDLSVQLLNARKLNIRCIVSCDAKATSLETVQLCVDIAGKEENMEILKKKLPMTRLAAKKEEQFKVQQDLPLPNAYPNIGRILWHRESLGLLEYKPMEGKLSVHAQMNLFIAYESALKEEEIAFYETTVPITGLIEVNGCQEDQVIELSNIMTRGSVVAKEDFDGEERILVLEQVVGFKLKCFEEQEVECVDDVYGINHEVKSEYLPMRYQKMIYTAEGKKKVVESIPIQDPGQLKGKELLHLDASARIEHIEKKENTLLLKGSLWVCQYMRDVSNFGQFETIEGEVDFSYEAAVAGLKKETFCHVDVDVEQIMVNPTQNLEVRALLNIRMSAFEEKSKEVLHAIESGTATNRKTTELPGMCIYFAKEGESLWSIGKQYCLPIEQIKETNHLTCDVLHRGDKLFLMKNA